MPDVLRCHLLIGPPASGKTTLAGVLAHLTGAVVLSTDVLRRELFGDAAVQERLFRLDLEVLQQVAAVVQRHPRWEMVYPCILFNE